MTAKRSKTNLSETHRFVRDFLDTVEPEEIAVMGVVIFTKEKVTDPHGDETNGFSVRVGAQDLDGLDDLNDVASLLTEYHDALDQMRYEKKETKHPIEALLSGD